MLDANIAGCVQNFVEHGKLNMFQTAMLGLSYRDATFVLPTLNQEGAAYFWRLERLAELVLREVALKNQTAAYQIVGRERRERLSHHHCSGERFVKSRRRVNSNVRCFAHENDSPSR
jgi:hypothetical protein